MSSNLSTEAEQARESARGADGKFGHQSATESVADLSELHAFLEGMDQAEQDRELGDYTGLKGKAKTEAMKKDLAEAINQIVESGQLGQYLSASAGNGMNRWSTGNQIWAALQLHQRRLARGEADPDDPSAFWGTMTNANCRTLKQWAELGRTKIDGEPSLSILRPNVVERVEEDEETGEEVTRRYLAGFRTMPVYDVSQTEGEPVPEHPSRPFTGQVAAGTVEGMKARVADLGYTYSEEKIPGCDPEKLTGTLAYVTYGTKQVVVDERLAPPEKAAALAHELGHIECGHLEEANDADRDLHRGRRETEAESFAYMMLRARGAEPEDAAAFAPGYIAGWSKGETRTIQQALDKSAKAFHTSHAAIDWGA